jgi:hypothetical protein
LRSWLKGRDGDKGQREEIKKNQEVGKCSVGQGQGHWHFLQSRDYVGVDED